MKRTCVLVADRLRARVFKAEPIRNHYHTFQLEEKMDLNNFWAQPSYGGRGDGSRSEAVQRFKDRYYSGYDHRQLDEDHDDRIFAKEITQQVCEFLKKEKTEQLVVVAPPQFLGVLRESKKSLCSGATDVKEVPKELSHPKVQEIREYFERVHVFRDFF